LINLLTVGDLHVRFGQSHVLQGVSFEVPEGGVTALLGRNGAGKTTTLKAILGLVQRAGKVELGAADISAEATHKIVRRGVGYVPEDREVFSELTVAENLRLAVRDPEPRYQLVHDLFPELSRRAGQRAGTLSGGQQQMVAIGRALMACPRLLLLDEPSLGLAPQIVDQVFEVVAGIHADGVAVLLVEQNVVQAFAIAARGYVLEQGRVVAEGAPSQLAQDARIREAYLGQQ
jgi:branched-chain amino acid transport system ATP-binding protein